MISPFAVEIAEGPVDGEAEILIAPGQRQGIGLDGEIVVRQQQLLRVLALLDQGLEDVAVGEIGRDLPASSIASPSAWVLADKTSAVTFRSSGELRKASSVVVSPRTPILRPAMACRLWGPSARIRSEAPSTKVGDREIDNLAARESGRGGFAEKVGLALLDRARSGRRRHRHIDDIEARQGELLGQALGHGAADLDDIALRLGAAGLEGEGRRIRAKCDAKRLVLAQAVENAGSSIRRPARRPPPSPSRRWPMRRRIFSAS